MLKREIILLRTELEKRPNGDVWLQLRDEKEKLEVMARTLSSELVATKNHLSSAIKEVSFFLKKIEILGHHDQTELCSVQFLTNS